MILIGNSKSGVEEGGGGQFDHSRGGAQQLNSGNSSINSISEAGNICCQQVWLDVQTFYLWTWCWDTSTLTRLSDLGSLWVPASSTAQDFRKSPTTSTGQGWPVTDSNFPGGGPNPSSRGLEESMPFPQVYHQKTWARMTSTDMLVAQKEKYHGATTLDKELQK